LARCLGGSNDVFPGGSLGAVYFPQSDDHYPTSAEGYTDPELCDVPMVEEALKLGMLLNGVNVVHGLGAISTSHTDEDLARVLEAYDRFARRLRASF
jgi:glutamate-1-semialdehyde aminotransferase